MKQSEYLSQLDVNAFLERPEVEAYVGKNYAYFKNLWQTDYAKLGNAKKITMRFHWNTLAFFIPFSWFAYRKMWGMALSLAALMVSLTFLEGYGQAHWNYHPSSTTYIGAQLVLCLTSKNIYFLHVVDFFRKHENTPPETLLSLAQEKGGVNILYAILSTIGFIAALIGSVIISDIIWPSPTGE